MFEVLSIKFFSSYSESDTEEADLLLVTPEAYEKQASNLKPQTLNCKLKRPVKPAFY